MTEFWIFKDANGISRVTGTDPGPLMGDRREAQVVVADGVHFQTVSRLFQTTAQEIAGPQGDEAYVKVTIVGGGG